VETQLKGLYVDTAASGATGLAPAVILVGVGHCVYGSDCGVACSTVAMIEESRQAVLDVEKRENGKSGLIGVNGWKLFPAAAQRALACAVK
jgi:hypothetical protein